MPIRPSIAECSTRSTTSSPHRRNGLPEGARMCRSSFGRRWSLLSSEGGRVRARRGKLGESMRRLILAAAPAPAIITTLAAAPANAAYVGHEGKIAFVRSNQIYTVAKTGGSVTKLTNSAKNYRPKWSPDGGRIAYVHEAAGSKDVWVMKVDGTGKTQVTHLGTVSAAAVWSPNGKVLAFGAGPMSVAGAQVFTIRSTAPFGAPVALPQAFSSFNEDF